MNAKIVSLSKVKKTKSRMKARAQADENAVKFGLTGAQKRLDNTKADKLRRDMDGHERQT